MAGWTPILQRMIQARIGASAPSVQRQQLPSAAISPAARDQKIHTWRNGNLLPAGKIAAILHLYGSKHFRGRRRVVISAIAAMSNLSRETVHQARRGVMSERTRALLSKTISAIERGEVTFHRVRQEWRVEYSPRPCLRIAEL
jgi:hypothetical protein